MQFHKLVKEVTSRPVLRIFIFLLISAGFFYLFYILLPMEYFIEEVVLFLSLLITSMIVESLRINGKWWSFGFRFDSYGLKNFFSGALLAILSISFILIVYKLMGAEISFTGLNLKPELFFLVLLILFAGAASEEIIFRGILFQTFVEKGNAVSGAIIINILFSFSHILNPHVSFISLINIFLVGILFSFMFIETLSLWMPISFHFFWNILEEMILDSPISGTRTFINLLSIDINESPVYTLLFGGEFGIESGLITTIIIIINFVILNKFTFYSPVQASNIFYKVHNESMFITNKNYNR